MSRPTKEQLQAWLKQRQESKLPPPSMEEIRRQLGWAMLNTKRECAR